MKVVRVALSVPLLLLMAQSGGEPLVLHPLMKDVVAVQAQALWDVGNNAVDDNGAPDPKKVSAANWAKLDVAAEAMKAAAMRMASAGTIQVAPAGLKLQDDGAPGALTGAQVQALIDGDRKGFADHALELAAISDSLIAAAASKDAAKLVDAAGTLDQVCEACHMKFWYPTPPEK